MKQLGIMAVAVVILTLGFSGCATVPASSVVVANGIAVDPFDYWYRDSFGRLHHVMDSGDIIIIGPAPVGIYVFEWSWYVGHPHYHYGSWRGPRYGHDYYRRYRPEGHQRPQFRPPQQHQPRREHQLRPQPSPQARPQRQHQFNPYQQRPPALRRQIQHQQLMPRPISPTRQPVHLAPQHRQAPSLRQPTHAAPQQTPKRNMPSVRQSVPQFHGSGKHK